MKTNKEVSCTKHLNAVKRQVEQLFCSPNYSAFLNTLDVKLDSSLTKISKNTKSGLNQANYKIRLDVGMHSYSLRKVIILYDGKVISTAGNTAPLGPLKYLKVINTT